MMTFSYRSCPLNALNLTICENEGWNATSTTHGRQIVMNTPPGAVVHVSLPPSKVNSWETKRLLIKTKPTINTLTGGTGTHHHALRQKPHDSRIHFTMRRIGSSISL
jgi:hypothetical protein